MTVDISNILTVLGATGSTAFTLWAHGREFNKEKRRTLQEYADAQVQAEGLRRDIRHLQRSLEQLSGNVAHLDEEAEGRFRTVEAQIGQLTGALNVLQSMLKQGA